MNVVVLGGTKGMGRAVARLLALRGDRIFLLGRDLEDLERSAADLGVRSARPATAGVARCDLAQPETFAPALAEARAALGGVDAVVVTAGQFATQEELESDLERSARLLTVNLTNTVVFCEQARTSLLASGGTLCVFSSVAGDRGRRPVGIYGAAKAGLSHYLESLDHRFHHQGLRVVCVKPGFVRTGMTAGLPEPPFAGEPDRVAADVVHAIATKRPVVYTPGVWRLVMLVVRALPRAIMRRVAF